MKAIRTIKDLKPDPHNANEGTERGVGLLEKSLRDFGAGRSILVDKNGVVIAGNKTLEQAAAIGLDQIVVVQTDGRKLVAVQRMDLDLAKDPRARAMALADNRVGEVGLRWSPQLVAAQVEDLAKLGMQQFFTEREIAEMLDQMEVEDKEGSFETTHECPKCGFKWTGSGAFSVRQHG